MDRLYLFVSTLPAPSFFKELTACLDSSTDLLIWAAAETAVIIIAASIPFLRLGLKELQGVSKKKSRSYNMDFTSNNFHTFGGTSATRTRIHTAAEGKAVRPDDRSDKSILGTRAASSTDIVRTCEISVEYHRGGVGDVESQKGSAVH